MKTSTCNTIDAVLILVIAAAFAYGYGLESQVITKDTSSTNYCPLILKGTGANPWYDWPTNFCINGDKLAHGDAAHYIELMRESGALTNVIEKLCASGEVCKVRGHVWDSTRLMLDNRPAGNIKKCRVCRWIEQRTEGEWK